MQHTHLPSSAIHHKHRALKPLYPAILIIRTDVGRIPITYESHILVHFRLKKFQHVDPLKIRGSGLVKIETNAVECPDLTMFQDLYIIGYDLLHL